MLAGKSALAARLAELYQLPLFSARDLLKATDKLTPEEAKVGGQKL
jgi:adenylate kinase family enzyme